MTSNNSGSRDTSRDTPRRNPIARAMGGWQPARVLMAANHLDFFTTIGENALSADEVASRCNTHPRPTRMLLNACAALGILEKEGELYRNSPEALESLVRGRPTFQGDGIAHQEDLWQSWGGLHEAVRTNSPTLRITSREHGAEVHRNFILAMHNRAMTSAQALAETLDLTGRRQLFDAGGGPGTYSIFLVKRYPGLKAIVFDLPPTVPITQEIIKEFGIADRITTRAGNYFRDDFGQGDDVVLLSAILHSMSPERSQGLFVKAFDSLVPGGLVVVHEALVSDDGTSPMRAVLFSLNMLVNTDGGQSYSAAEITGLMQEAGFVEPRVVHLPPMVGTSLVISEKP
jgi:hypothetical protein